MYALLWYCSSGGVACGGACGLVWHVVWHVVVHVVGAGRDQMEDYRRWAHLSDELHPPEL